MVYRLKDWPSGEEFMALMPSRFCINTIYLFVLLNVNLSKPKTEMLKC